MNDILKAMRLSLVLLLNCLVLLRLAGAELRICFDSLSRGEIPSGFVPALCGEGAPARWELVLSEVPPTIELEHTNTPVETRRLVLAHVSNDPTDERFPLLIYEPEIMTDFELETKLRISGGTVAQMAGIAFRLQNPSNFYVIRLSASGRNLKFYKVVNGLRGELIGPDLPISTGKWYRLKIECKGNMVRAWLDDVEVLPALFDNTFARGKIAFWTKSDSLAEFAELSVKYVPVEWPIKKLVAQAKEKFPRTIAIHVYGRPPGTTNVQVVASTGRLEDASHAWSEVRTTLSNGQAFVSVGDKTTVVLMPIRDRNGEPVAVAEIEIKNAPIQTVQNALSRCRPIVGFIQSAIRDEKDLYQ